MYYAGLIVSIDGKMRRGGGGKGDNPPPHLFLRRGVQSHVSISDDDIPPGRGGKIAKKSHDNTHFIFRVTIVIKFFTEVNVVSN